MKTEMSVEAVSILPLPRGVHREVTTYAGYVAYKAITRSGVIAAHLLLMESVDCPNRRDFHVAHLWEMIERAETQENPRHGLHIQN